MTEQRVVFVACHTYEMYVCQVELKKETAKSYIPDQRTKRNVWGNGIKLPERINKQDRQYRVFDTRLQALQHLFHIAAAEQGRLQAMLNRQIEFVSELQYGYLQEMKHEKG